jgi:uncharacterized protein (TIGR02266 family)
MAEPIDKDTRGPVNLRIKFRSESLQQFIERYGVDVSRGGIFIRTREPLPVGTRLKLDFQLVDTAPLFQGDGTVVWIREHDASRAGVTPGMGVRFDRLSPESQTTLDTILEEKIRLQQSGVAPGSIAKAGAGIAVRRPSGAFATLDAPGGKGPPPLPVRPIAPGAGAAPASPMPLSSSRSGAHATTGSNSIFSRPRTTSGVRAVVGPSALFEPPTAADIDKALSILEEKGGPAPALSTMTPMVINRSDTKPSTDDDPTRVFDSNAAEEFSRTDAVTGKSDVLPESGVPTATEGEGELTQRRSVDPVSGDVKGDVLFDATGDGKAHGDKKGDAPAPAATLDAPLASLVDSGAAPAAKPAAPPPSKPAASPPKTAPGKSMPGVPMRITTDRPAATESGRFRSDARYKRQRGKGLYWAIAILIIGAGAAGSALYVKRERDKRAAAAVAAAAAAPPLAAGQVMNPPTPANPLPPEAATGAAGAAPAPAEAAGTEAPAKTAPPRPDEAVARPDGKGAKPEKSESAKGGEKAAPATDKAAQEGQPRRRRERSASATAAAAAKAAESAGAADKKPPGDEAKTGEAKGGDTAKPEAPKAAEGAKAAEGDKGETAKPAEATAPPVTVDRPTLKITSSPPGADVVIDGVPVGTTPFSSRDVSADGTHAISVKKDGYEPHERMISGSDWSRAKGGGQALKFNVKLKRSGGEQKPAEAGDKGEKKEAKPEVEILTPSEP